MIGRSESLIARKPTSVHGTETEQSQCSDVTRTCSMYDKTQVIDNLLVKHRLFCSSDASLNESYIRLQAVAVRDRDIRRCKRLLLNDSFG